MINVRISYDSARDSFTQIVRAEAARVFIPGFEQFTFYAIPNYVKGKGFIDGAWAVVEEKTGARIGTKTTPFGATVDEAAEIAKAFIQAYRITPELLQSIVDSEEAIN